MTLALANIEVVFIATGKISKRWLTEYFPHVLCCIAAGCSPANDSSCRGKKKIIQNHYFAIESMALNSLEIELVNIMKRGSVIMFFFSFYTLFV